MPTVASWTRQESWTSALSVSLPSGTTAGDLLILAISSPAAVTGVPGGWELIYADDVADQWGYLDARCYWRTAGQSETAPTVTFAAVANVTGALLRITSAGAPPIAASGYAALSSPASSIAAPSLTPDMGGTLALTLAHAYYRLHTASPSGYTEIFAPSAWGDGGGNGFLRAAEAAGPAAGVASASPSWPCAASSLYQIAGHLLIAPASLPIASGGAVTAGAALDPYPATQPPLLPGRTVTAASDVHPYWMAAGDLTGGAETGGNALDVVAQPGLPPSSGGVTTGGNALDITLPTGARGPGEQYAYTMRVSHPSLPAPICLIADSRAMLIDGELYQPWPLQGVTPVRHEAAGEAQIDVCIVDRTYLAALHEAHAGGIEPVVEFGAVDVVRGDVYADRAVGLLRRTDVRSQTEMTMVVGPYSPIDEEPVSVTFTPGRFPALFRS